jgi:hypothetical protein
MSYEGDEKTAVPGVEEFRRTEQAASETLRRWRTALITVGLVLFVGGGCCLPGQLWNREVPPYWQSVGSGRMQDYELSTVADGPAKLIFTFVALPLLVGVYYIVRHSLTRRVRDAEQALLDSAPPSQWSEIRAEIWRGRTMW